MGSRTITKWTNEDISKMIYLFNNTPNTNREIANLLNKPFRSFSHMAHTKLKLKKPKGLVTKINERTHKGIHIKELNNMWVGDKIGYEALHGWIRRNKPKIDICEKCKIQPSRDLANISGQYKRDINDFEWLCRKCHMVSDGRIFQLKQYQL